MNATELGRRLDTLSAQVAFLVEKQQKREELYDELAPVLREVMSTATEKLDAAEKKGWFAFGRALGEVTEKILDHYSADDVRALGNAVVDILDTVKLLTQPAVLATVGEVGEALQHPDEAKPLGMVGMMRASRDADVKKGMAVLMEVLRRVGRAAQEVSAKHGDAGDRKARLAAALGPRRKKLRALPPPPANGAGCTIQKPVEVDISGWTREQAEQIAAGEGITLGADHWKLIEAARADYAANKAAANIRRLTQIAGVTTKEIYALFPKAPGRTIARIAGTPKPVGCI